MAALAAVIFTCPVVSLGDADGIVVVPAHLAEEVARDADEPRIQQGARLPGTYPPNAETRAACDAWRNAQG